ncbi:MAG TPA: hypothetical protein VFL92_06440 [Sphingomonas sp.]|nr:hypothetical protein [Sphingomonas sp.]
MTRSSLTSDDDPGLTLEGRPRRRAPRRLPPAAITPDMLEGAPDFTPAPSATRRYDGWTPERQRAFVKALAEIGSVRRAARRVGMTAVGAYRLRRTPGAEGFRKAWEEAQAIGVETLSDIAWERAIYGTPKPVWYKGEQVGEERRYNDRLLMFTLRHHDPERYGASITGADRVPPHIRAALRREWEAERAEHVKGAKERLAAKLEQMRQRMKEAGEISGEE